MKVIVITPESPRPELAKQLNAMALSSVFKIHVRFPELNEADTRAFLNELDETTLNKVVLHYHYQLANTLQLGGIHYPELYRLGEQAFEKNYPGSISSSFHFPESIDWFLLDYVFCSPIFPSISKENHFPDHKLKQWQLAIEEDPDTPAIALGGVCPDQFKVIKDAGFQGVGLLGHIWFQDDPVAELANCIQLIADLD
ncbi:MAG: thiamine-phosphate pyrophosphorylase [Luteibaculaceae bacterium]|jgi:thiamine-phosphate pyrophosphorylase